MKLKRFGKSFINNLLFLINAILWIFNIKSIGEMATGVQVGTGKKQKFMYGICTLLQYFSYLCIIGLVLTIYWWSKEQSSIAEKLSGLHIEKISPASKPENMDNSSTTSETLATNVETPENQTSNSNTPENSIPPQQ